MEWNKGLLAIVVVTIAVLGSLAIGYFGSVSKETVTYADWEQITDVQSLYTYEDVPLYTQYTPVENWTKWDNADFITSPSSNRYIVDQGYDGSTTVSIDVTGGTTYTNHSDNAPITFWSSYTYYLTYTENGTETTVSNNITIVPLYDRFGSVTGDGTITINGGYLSNTGDMRISYSEHGFIYKEHRNVGNINVGTVVASAKYDYHTAIVTAYDSNDAVLWTADLSDVYYVYKDTAGTVSVDVPNHLPPVYMDIAQGLTLKQSPSTDPNDIESAVWRNGYENGRIQILITTDNPTIETVLEMQDTLGSWNLTLVVGKDSGMWYYNDSPRTQIGAGEGVIVEIDAQELVCRFTPVISMNTFTDYTASVVTSSFPILQMLPPGASVFEGYWVSSFSMYTTDTDVHVGVVDTSVLLGAVNTTMGNPTLNVGNVFPDLVTRDYRIDVGAPAVVGDSVTVFGNTIPVVSGSYVLNGKTHSVGGISCKAENGNAYIRFNGDPRPDWIQIGTVDNNSITFSGEWYFDTSIVYDSITETREEVHFGHGENMTWDSVLLVAIGILVALSLILYAKTEYFGFYNGVIVIIAVAIMFYMLV